MSRYCFVILLLPVCLAISACSKTQEESTDEAAVQVPPAEARPPSVRPALKWLPESPRYQEVRREAFRQKDSMRAELDLSTTRLTNHGRYRVSITGRPEPVLHQFQSWLLRIETAEGKPVANARLSVSGGMPEHGHGMPTQPKVKAGTVPGEYRVDGLQFSMPGWWEVNLFVDSAAARDDAVTFNLIIE